MHNILRLNYKQQNKQTNEQTNQKQTTKKTKQSGHFPFSHAFFAHPQEPVVLTNHRSSSTSVLAANGNCLTNDRKDFYLMVSSLLLRRSHSSTSSSQRYYMADSSCPRRSFPTLPSPISWRASFPSFLLPPSTPLPFPFHWSSTSVIGAAAAVESVSIAAVQAPFPQSGPVLATGARNTGELHPSVSPMQPHLPPLVAIQTLTDS